MSLCTKKALFFMSTQTVFFLFKCVFCHPNCCLCVDKTSKRTENNCRRVGGASNECVCLTTWSLESSRSSSNRPQKPIESCVLLIQKQPSPSAKILKSFPPGGVGDQVISISLQQEASYHSHGTSTWNSVTLFPFTRPLRALF